MDAGILNTLKELAKEPAFVAEMKVVFFEAMMAGYASSEKIEKSTIAELPGSKLIPPYVKGPWKVSDPYLVNAPLSSYSGGMTVISYERVPVWMMQYFGQYPEEAIPCLKAALRAAYSERKFFGGRGPEEFVYGDSDFTYYNKKQVLDRHYFTSFNGSESVFSKNGKRLGYHSYQGGVML